MMIGIASVAVSDAIDIGSGAAAGARLGTSACRDVLSSVATVVMKLAGIGAQGGFAPPVGNTWVSISPIMGPESVDIP